MWHALVIAMAVGLKGLAIVKGHPEAADNLEGILVAGAFGNATINAARRGGRQTDAHATPPPPLG